ncbi:MAG: substrate-binding domain-containing protein [Lachnospiraceae bacterium]|nr:substrate-binding domain-containing protein [Lachnospiraceae bacterium]
MKSRIIALGLIAVLLTGCSGAGEISETVEEYSGTYAFVTKSEGNAYNERMAQGFQEVIESSGGNCLIYNPEEATAEAQIEILQDLLMQGMDSITVAANDEDALSSVLTDAMEQGICISTVDSDVSADVRQVFVNQASAEEIARTLIEAVYDITGGSGQWAILSASSQATNQNAWIRAMRSVMEEERYQDLRLVDIVYGNDETEASKEKTEELLENYPDLKVICAPTTMGLAAAAEVLAEREETDVKATGLGLPSSMSAYVRGEEAVCPYFYLWNPVDLGRMSACVSLALKEGTITGAAGETFETGDMGTIEIQENEYGGTEVIAASLTRFDAENIEEWETYF